MYAEVDPQIVDVVFFVDIVDIVENVDIFDIFHIVDVKVLILSIK